MNRFVLGAALFFWLFTASQASAEANNRAPGGACSSADAELPAEALQGLWQLRLWPEDGQESSPVSTGALLLGPHPEYAGSVRGRLRRTGPGPDLEADVSGDVSDGEFNLDESADGATMDAVWTGVPEDCGRSIRGVRRPAEGRGPATGPLLQFSLRKASSVR